MSAAEETIKTRPASQRPSAPALNRALDFLSSVRFGVVQLCILVVLAMAGMLILQQNVDGFDAYYVSLTPAERVVFGYLGLFDIYHSWYVNLILLTLSLNIILATIDRFLAESKSTNAEHLVLKGNALYRMQKYPEAAAVLKQAIASTPNPRADWQALLMGAMAESGD